MLNLKLIRFLDINGRKYVHYLKGVDISFVTSSTYDTRSLMTVELYVSGSFRKFDSFDVSDIKDNRGLLEHLGNLAMDDISHFGTMIVNHKEGTIQYINENYISELEVDDI